MAPGKIKAVRRVTNGAAKSSSNKGNNPPNERMRTRSSNADKHPGLVDLDIDEDGSTPAPPSTKSSNRRGGSSKTNATSSSAPGNLDSLLSGMTAEQKSAVLAIFHSKLEGNNPHRSRVNTLDEHYQESVAQAAARQAEDNTTREKTEEVEDVDESMVDEDEDRQPSPLRRTYAQDEIMNDGGNTELTSYQEFSDFQPMEDASARNNDHDVERDTYSPLNAKAESSKGKGKRKAMEPDERDGSEELEDDRLDVMAVDDDNEVASVVRPMKKARPDVPSGLVEDWQKRISTPSRPTVHSENGKTRPSPLASHARSHSRPSQERATTDKRLEPLAAPNAQASDTPSAGVLSEQVPFRAKQRTTEAMAVEVQLKGRVASKHGKEVAVSPEKGQKRITHTSDLPLPAAVPNAELLWSDYVVRRYIAYIGSLRNPWDANSHKEEDDILRMSWYEAFEVNLEGESSLRKARNIASQRASEWRTKIGKAAVKVFDKFLEEGEYQSEVQRKAYYEKYVASCNKSPRLLYSNAESTIGAYRSDLVLETFAVHIETVPGLESEFGPPIGALALCAAAIERAALMWKTGRKLSEKERAALIDKARQDTSNEGRKNATALQLEAKKVKTFSDTTWGSVTVSHAGNAAKLKTRAWDQVVTGATSFSRKGGVASGQFDGGMNETEREMVLSDDDDIDN